MESMGSRELDDPLLDTPLRLRSKSFTNLYVFIIICWCRLERACQRMRKLKN